MFVILVFHVPHMKQRTSGRGRGKSNFQISANKTCSQALLVPHVPILKKHFTPLKGYQRKEGSQSF
jgi:hypothetical protein